MAEKNALDWIALVLVIVGAINWGLVGLFDLNVVEAVLGTGLVAKIVYILVGLSGIWMIYLASKK